MKSFDVGLNILRPSVIDFFMPIDTFTSLKTLPVFGGRTKSTTQNGPSKILGTRREREPRRGQSQIVQHPSSIRVARGQFIASLARSTNDTSNVQTFQTHHPAIACCRRSCGAVFHACIPPELCRPGIGGPYHCCWIAAGRFGDSRGWIVEKDKR